jgi:hypothetical protein
MENENLNPIIKGDLKNVKMYEYPKGKEVFTYFAGVDPVDLDMKTDSKIQIMIRKGNEYIYSTSKDTFEEIVEAINKQDLGFKAKLVEND